MALIKCPECGGDVSDQAPACIHCGYPIQKEKATVYYVLVIKTLRENAINIIIDVLGYNYMGAQDIMRQVNRRGSNGVAIAASISRPLVESVYQQFKEYDSEVYIVTLTPGQHVDFAFTNNVLRQLPEEFGITPKCPTCGSRNITKISNLSRGASVFMWGGMSGKINKSFKCNNCGYTW